MGTQAQAQAQAAVLLEDLPDRPLNSKASHGITSGAFAFGTKGTTEDAHCLGTFLFESIKELSELESFGFVGLGPVKWGSCALACIAGAVDRRVLTLSKDLDLLPVDDISTNTTNNVNEK